MEWQKEMLNQDTLFLEGGIYRQRGREIAKGAYDEFQHEDVFRLEDESWWFKSRNNVIEAGLRAFPLPNNLIVDVGAGNGIVSAHLEKAGIKTILFEPGYCGIRNAKNRGLKSLVCAPFDDTTIKGNSVPAVGLFDVLEHVEDEGGFLKNIWNGLADGGLLYVTVPAHETLWSHEDELVNHYRRYNEKSLNKTMRNNGFNVLFGSYFFRFLSPLIFTFRTLPYRLNPNKRREQFKKAQIAPSGMLGKAASAYFASEAKRIASRKSMSHGASIFMVCQKKESRW